MNAASPDFFLLLIFGAILAYGLMPAFAFAPAFVILAFLWVLAKAPIVAITRAVAWLLRWLIVDFFVAFVAGFGGGLGLRASGVVPRPRGRARRAISAQKLIRQTALTTLENGDRDDSKFCRAGTSSLAASG